MTHSQAPEPVVVEGLTIKAKLKNCGNPECTQCPHGPYYYATIPAGAAASGQRIEKYLGGSWTPDSLEKAVAGQLKPAPRKALKAWAQRHRDQAELEQVQRAESNLLQWRQAREEAHQRELSTAARELGDLQRRAEVLRAKLKG